MISAAHKTTHRKMIQRIPNWKECERKRSWPNFRQGGVPDFARRSSVTPRRNSRQEETHDRFWPGHEKCFKNFPADESHGVRPSARADHKASANYCLKSCYIRRPWNCWLYGRFHRLAGKICISFQHLNVQKLMRGIVEHDFLISVSEKSELNYPFRTDSTAYSNCHSDTSCISLGLFADQHVTSSIYTACALK
jgi:hypothetical protein